MGMRVHGVVHLRPGSTVVHVMDYWETRPKTLREILGRTCRLWEVYRIRKCVAYIRVADMDTFHRRHGIHPKDMLYVNDDECANDTLAEEGVQRPPA